jgi:PAS domain-containing protein
MPGFDHISKLLHWQSTQSAIATGYNFSLQDHFVFPHQVAYVVECQTGQIVEATPRFGKIFGYEEQELNHVQQLYEPIVKTDLVATLRHTHLAWIFKNEDVPALLDGQSLLITFAQSRGRLHGS